MTTRSTTVKLRKVLHKSDRGDSLRSEIVIPKSIAENYEAGTMFEVQQIADMIVLIPNYPFPRRGSDDG